MPPDSTAGPSCRRVCTDLHNEAHGALLAVAAPPRRLSSGAYQSRVPIGAPSTKAARLQMNANTSTNNPALQNSSLLAQALMRQ